MCKTVLIICGALAQEVIAIKKKYDWDVDIFGIPTLLHNRPDRIPAALQNRIATLREQYDRLIVVYGDCGTAGSLDKLLASEGVERVAGPHCYEMYANGTFDQIVVGDCSGCFQGIFFTGRPFNKDLKHPSCSFGIQCHLVGQITA